jgi:hypothetical protein
MEFLIVLFFILALLGATGLAAARFGTDSREGFTDARLHQEWR